jgi:ribosome-binding factor A
MSTIRQEQIARRMVEEISAMLLRDLKDPRLSMVTVTHADISRDLRHARVFISVIDPERQEPALAALKSAAGYIRGEFTRRARLRVAPEIDFRPDTGIAHGARIFELLKEIEAENSTKSPGAS